MIAFEFNMLSIRSKHKSGERQPTAAVSKAYACQQLGVWQYPNLFICFLHILNSLLAFVNALRKNTCFEDGGFVIVHTRIRECCGTNIDG